MRGVTRHTALFGVDERISTRTPHAGSDLQREIIQTESKLISTRTPHAGSDSRERDAHDQLHISTRTPHAGSDLTGTIDFEKWFDFNPHSPCGE